MKKFAKMLVLAAAMVMMVGAGDVAEAKGSVSKVQITKVGKTNVKKKSALTLKRDGSNKKVQLTVNVTTKNGASKAVKFKSSNAKVVSVNSKGVMTLKKAGKATITVTSKQNSKKKDTIKITVKQNVTSIKVAFTGKTKPVASKNGVYTLVKGKKYQVKATASPSKASNKKVSFKSSKKSVATVSSTGKISAKKSGTAKITVTAKDGSKTKKVITVYVINKKVAKKNQVKSMSAKLDKDLLIEGDTANVVVTVNKSATLKKYSFKSSNTKVAKVDAASGKVTALVPGTATITAYAMDGSGKKATVKVTVTRKTFVTPVEGVKADVTVSFKGDSAKVANDITQLIKAAGVFKDGQSVKVKVNGKEATVVLEKGEVMVVGKNKKETLAKYIADKKAENDKVELTYTANAAKAVAAVEMATLVVGDATYNYEITIDGHKATSMVISKDGIKVVIDEKTYDAVVKAGVIEIMGDVTDDAVIKDLVAKGYVKVTTTAK